MIRTVPLPAALAALGLLATAGAAAAPDLDSQRGAWQHRREVAVPAGAQGFAALPLPPQVLGHSQAELQDLRLFGPGGVEVPYVIDRRQERYRSERYDGKLVDTIKERWVRSVWTMDLGAPRRFDTIELTIRDVDFAKRLTIEAGEDGKTWRILRADAGVFDQPWQPWQRFSQGPGRVHHTTVVLPQLAGARYLRITAQDMRTRAVTLEGLAVLRERLAPEERWTMAAALAPQPGPKGTSRYRVDAPPGLPVEALTVAADDAVFARRVSLVEEEEKGGQTRRAVRGSGLVYRLRLKDAEVDGESLDLTVNQPGEGTGALVLEVEDGDSPPLRGLRLTLAGTASRLIFPLPLAASGADHAAAPGPLVLYYGNPATRAPSYDLEVLRDALSRHESFIAAAVGPEERNPRYQPPPPLQVTMSPGALMSLERWRYMRPMPLPPREDLYGLVLEPADLGALREDLGDLRISSSEGRQIPYVLETETPPRRMALTVERQPAKERVSRYLLRPEAPAGQTAAALPLLAIELEIAEGAFSRPARLIDPAADERAPPLQREVLARREGALPLRLAVPPGRYRELVLEIDDGDNAPLTIQKAFGVGRLPRIAFKLGPAVGLCRLFLGNPEADAPRYDIEALRQQVLDYSAVPASAGPLQANLAYRQRAGDFVRSAPPAAILWGTLLLSVLAMLLLTARLVRKH